jgi:flagellar basal body rod protein FlgG
MGARAYVLSSGQGFQMLRRTVVAAALTALVALGACASVGAQEKEGQLAAAGFVRLQADTPAKVAKLQALPQNSITYAQRKGGNVYIYADAAGCNCAYVGNDAAYQQYQQIRAANNIAQMQETTAMLNAEAANDWGGAYGPMVPYWY